MKYLSKLNGRRAPKYQEARGKRHGGKRAPEVLMGLDYVADFDFDLLAAELIAEVEVYLGKVTALDAWERGSA